MRGNPLRHDSRLIPDEAELSDIVGEMEEAEAARSGWVENQRALTEQRYGISRGIRTVPWPGASDIHIPTQDKVIRRWKPKILNLVFEAQPVAYFRALEPSDVEAARLVEQFYDWLFRYSMTESIDEICYLADMIAHRGFGILQVTWDYTREDETRVLEVADFWPDGLEGVSDAEIVSTILTEYEMRPEDFDVRMLSELRQGADRLVMQFRRVVRDRPRVIARDPIDVLVSEGATDFDDAEWVAVRQRVSPRRLRGMARDGYMVPSAVETVLEGARRITPEIGDRDLLRRYEGVSEPTEPNPEIYEVYSWTSGPETRRRVLWIHVPTRTVLGAQPYVYPFAEWPFVRFDMEKSSRSWYGSRGLSRMLAPLAKTIDRLHNARLDAIAIQLAPAYVCRTLAGLPKNFEVGPGKIIGVESPDDIRPLVQDLRNLLAYTQEEYGTRQYAEDYAGVYDSSLMNVLKPTERRTATEVAYVADQVQGTFSLDARLFQRSMGKVHRMIWRLWYDLGREEVFFRVMNEEQPRLFRRSEVPENYDIVPAGTPAGTNKALELARAREALGFFANDQSGVVDRAELFKWYLSLLDWALAKRVIRGPEEQRARDVLLAAANEVASGKLEEVMRRVQTEKELARSG